MALLEVLIAGVILAVVLVGFLQGLNVTLLGTERDSKMNSAQHIAQSQMEYIKSLPFNNQSQYSTDIIDTPDIAVCSWCDDCFPEELKPPEPFDSLKLKQLITVTVSYNNTNLASQDYRVVLKSYKIDR